MSIRKIALFCLLLLLLSSCGSTTVEGSIPPSISVATPTPVPESLTPTPDQTAVPTQTAMVTPVETVEPIATPVPTRPSAAPVTPYITQVPVPSATATPMPTATPTPVPTPTATPITTATPAPTATTSPAPTDEQVIEAYRRAEEAYEWFHSYPLPVAEERQEVGGVLYQRVDYPDISTLDELRAYLRNLFSDEIVDTLLPVGGTKYIDLDGVLYALVDTGDLPPEKGSETRQVIHGSNGKISIRVAVELLDPTSGEVTGTQTYVFPYEQVGEKWIFTSFSLT